jgi:hypothetical protein
MPCLSVYLPAIQELTIDMSTETITSVLAYWPSVSGFFNSTFFTSIAGSFAGAIAGAYGAQRIAERGKQREELSSEIRNLNAASMVAFTICNSLLSLKSEHVKRLKEDYYRERDRVIEHRGRVERGDAPSGIAITYIADLQTLPLLSPPSDLLRIFLLDRVSSVSRATALYLTLQQVLNSLNTSIKKRNDLIKFFQENQDNLSEEDRAILYFGLPYKGGSVNLEYSAAIDSIYEQLDDAIFFSYHLCRDLVRIAEKIRARYKSLFGKRAPKVNTISFEKALAEGLVPNEDRYAGWLSNVKEESEAP